MNSLRTATTSVLVATLVLTGMSTASAADDESFPYSGPSSVTGGMSETDALASISDMPSRPVRDPDLIDGFNPGSPGGGDTTNCIACIEPKKTETQKTAGPTLVKKRFVRYLTGAWANSTGYVWTKATAVTATLSASIDVGVGAVTDTLGVSKSRTQTYSIAVNIYASKSKLSKLGLYSDYQKYSVRTRTKWMGETSAWKSATLYAPTANQYLIATYK